MADVSVVYVGTFDVVDVPALNLSDVVKGKPVSVSQEAAEDLIRQGIWELAQPQ